MAPEERPDARSESHIRVNSVIHVAVKVKIYIINVPVIAVANH
jgi:hypothetical protein